MSQPTPTSPPRAAVEPLPENVTSVQPGGGICYTVELAWGRWRRWLLQRFFRDYVARMAERRHGDASGAPHEILDPRDLKYCRNQCQCDWDPADDPFAWRDRLPFARWGLAELQLMGWPLLAITLLVGWWFGWGWATLPAIPLFWVAWFFRDPPRRVPRGMGLLVSPADGRIVEITRVEHDPFVGGPAVRIGIFLSIFNVHINRSPCRARVIALRYHPGRFLNAIHPASALENENMWIGLEDEAWPHRRLVVRQIAGAIARRIVCGLRPGEVIEVGAKFGMIKLGSRTELIVAEDPELHIDVSVGQRVRAGATVVARYAV